MTRYPRYKNSGVTWLGDIPEGWDMKYGKCIFTENKLKNKTLDQKTILSLSYGKIVVKKSPNEGLVPAEYSSYQVLTVGDIVIRCTDLQNDQNSLRVGFVENPGIITSAYLGLKVNHGFSPRFVFYYLHTWDISKEIYRYGSGLRQSLSWEDLKYLPCLLPPLPEQEAIVRYLDETTGKIDKAIAAEERLIELLQERKQIIINETVTRGLESNAKLRPSGVAWLGDIPEGWDVRKIFVVFEENTEKNNSFVIRHAMKFNYGKLIDKNEDFDVDAMRGVYSKYTLIRQDDIVINGLNLNYDMVSQRVAIAPKNGIITSAYITIRPRNYVCPNYYCYLFKGMDSKKIFHGMGCGIRLTLSFKDLKNQLIPLPPLHEQEAIVKYLDEETGKIDRAIEVKRRQIALLRERREIIIDEVVTGKVKVA